MNYESLSKKPNYEYQQINFHPKSSTQIKHSSGFTVDGEFSGNSICDRITIVFLNMYDNDFTFEVNHRHTCPADFLSSPVENASIFFWSLASA